jgi:hypothetical protein
MKAILFLVVLVPAAMWIGLIATKGIKATEDPFEGFRRLIAPHYTPVELWDLMLGGVKPRDHFFSHPRPSSWSYVRIEGLLSRIEPSSDKHPSVSPALIFAVDRSSLWNGITLHGFLRATLQRKQQDDYARFTPGQKLRIRCQVVLARCRSFIW